MVTSGFEAKAIGLLSSCVSFYPPPPPPHPHTPPGLSSPLLYSLEGLLVRQVKHDDKAHCSTVVRGRDGAVPFLAGSIPYLQLNSLVVPITEKEHLTRG